MPGLKIQTIIESSPKFVAAGAAALPQENYRSIPQYGDYLTTHGLLIFSYAEWFTVFAAMWVLLMLIEKIKNYIAPAIKRIFKKLK